MTMSSFQSLLLFNSLYLNSVCNRNNAAAASTAATVAINSKNKQKILETKVEDLAHVSSSSSSKKFNDSQNNADKNKDDDQVSTDAHSSQLDSKTSTKMDYLYESASTNQPIINIASNATNSTNSNSNHPYNQPYQFQLSSGCNSNTTAAVAMAAATSFYLNRGYDHQPTYSDSSSSSSSLSSSSNTSLNSSQLLSNSSVTQPLISSPPSSISSASSSSNCSISGSTCSSLNNSTDYIHRHATSHHGSPSPQYPFFASPIPHNNHNYHHPHSHINPYSHHHPHHAYLPYPTNSPQFQYQHSIQSQHSFYHPSMYPQSINQLNDSPSTYLNSSQSQDSVKQDRKDCIQQTKVGPSKPKKSPLDESPVSAVQHCNKTNSSYKFYQENPISVKSTAFITPSLMSIEASQRRKRRQRTQFSKFQLSELEKLFHSTRYPDIYCREDLSARIGIAESRIQVWFKNRRSKIRKDEKFDYKQMSAYSNEYQDDESDNGDDDVDGSERDLD